MTKTVGERIEALAAARGISYGMELAERLGVSYETLRKWRNGTAAPNRSRQMVLSGVLGVPPATFMFEGREPLGVDRLPEPLGVTDPVDEVTAVLLGDAVGVPLLSAAASMGPGTTRHDDVVLGRLNLSTTWIHRAIKPLTHPGNLRFIHGQGDSMAPSISDGDVLLVDSGVQTIAVDGIYVLGAQDRLFVKRVRQRIGGDYEISSDNPTVKTVDVLDGSHQVDVLGKVAWIWNGRKV